MRAPRTVLALAILVASGCRTTTTTTPTPTLTLTLTQARPTTGPAHGPEPDPAPSTAAVPTGTAAVAELLAEPARFLDAKVELEVRVGWKGQPCADPAPWNCPGEVMLLDVGSDRILELRSQDIGAVTACKPGKPEPGLSSPCFTDQVIDSDQRYLVAGVLRRDAAGLYFEPGLFIHRGPPGGPPSVSEITFLAERYTGREIEIEAWLEWTQTGCTNHGCTGSEWQVRDRDGYKSLKLRLDPDGIDVPLVCVTAPAVVSGPSPCANGKALDRATRHRLRGELIRSGGELVFVARSIDRI